MRSAFALGLFFCLALSRPVRGQESEGAVVAHAPVELVGGRAPVRLELDVQAGVLRQYSPRGDLQEEWLFESGVTPIAQIPANRPVSFEVTNANPLLYSYNLDATTVRSGTSAPCRVSAGAFLTDGLLAGSTVFSGLTDQAFAGGSLADLVGLDLEAMVAGGTRGEILTAMQLQSYVQGMARSVQASLERSGELVRILESVGDSLAYIARAAETRPLSGLSEEYMTGLEDFEPGLGTAVSAAEAVERVLLSTGEDMVRFRSVARSLREGKGALEATPAAQTVLGWASRLEELAGRAAAAALPLQSALVRLQQAASRSSLRFAIASAKGDSRRLTLRVQKTDDFPNVFRAREGQVTAYTRPRPSLRCSVGLAVVWTSPAPDFSLDEDGLVENLARGDDLAVSPALLFEVGLPQLRAVALHGGIGAGAARVPDLFAGGALHFSPTVGLAVGVVWRRVRALPEGTGIGDRLPAGIGLSDLEHRFDREIYWGITFTR
jgi:hypothetical protein